MPTLNDLEESVMAFVAREASANRNSMSPETDVVRDLGVDGDDGMELVAKFAEHFRVDLSSFDSSVYFGPEASFNPLAVFLPSWWRMRRRLRPLRIAI